MNEQTSPSHAANKPGRYAPRWVSYASAILDDLYDGSRSARTDGITKGIMLTCLQTLAKGNALSDAQRDAFVENVRVRLGMTNFSWEGPIQLSRGQLRGGRELYDRWKAAPARDNSTAAFEQLSGGVATALIARVEALETTVAQVLRIIGSGLASNLPNFCTIAAESGANALEERRFPHATEHNYTERNHDGGMICPSGDMIAMAPAGREPTAANDHIPSTSDADDGCHGQGQVNARQWGDRMVVSYFRNDPERSPSANLEIAGERYSLVFHPADLAEERLRTVCTLEWLQFFDEGMGEILRAQSRAHPSSDFRYVMSPLYCGRDRFGQKEPIVANSVAVLQWGNDGQPQSVIVVVDDQATTVPLRATGLTKEKAPTHKGKVRLAA
jgi:hypothetical protein